MNENEMKKNDSQDKPKETVYEDFELFDLDALRKNKPEPQQKQSPLPSEKPSENSDVKKQTAPAARVYAPKTKQAEPKTAPKPSITDVKPDKVVFDASEKQRRLPSKQSKKKEPSMKPIKPIKEKTRGANPIAVLSKALIYVALVLLVSCLCAYYVIVIANDVFAFVKADAQIEVIVDEYATLDQIAEELHEKQVIRFPKIFVIYTMVRGNDPGKYLAGKYTVSPQQNFDELLSTFVEKRSNSLTEVSVTIPEGYTVDDIINLLVNEKGVGTREGFVDAIQNGEYDYWFIKELTNLDPNRKYRLEGYLYPDTYYIYKESEETAIINKMLANFHSKFSIEYKQECEKAGMTVDQVVNFASLIQMEAKYTTEYTLVSSVFHNRLNTTYYGRKLESCASVQYILPERKDRLTNEDTLIDNPYNTYQNGGLPPGPITNPTLKAIRAALYPEQTGYYFFVNDMEGHMVFAKTYAEHLKNKNRIDTEYAASQNG